MKVPLIITLLAAANMCIAAEPFCNSGKAHPIELRLENRIRAAASGDTTAGALQDAYEQWDKELNKAYRELMGILKPEDQLALKESQRAWLNYRNQQANLWNSEALYGGSGSIGRDYVSDLIRSMLSQRVCELIRYKAMAYTGPGA